LSQEKPKPTDVDIDAAVTSICRRGTLRRLYWDTALSWRPPVLADASPVVGLGEVQFRSDYWSWMAKKAAEFLPITR
jgi:hypothetical protein